MTKKKEIPEWEMLGITKAVYEVKIKEWRKSLNEALKRHSSVLNNTLRRYRDKFFPGWDRNEVMKKMSWTAIHLNLHEKYEKRLKLDLSLAKTQQDVYNFQHILNAYLFYLEFWKKPESFYQGRVPINSSFTISEKEDEILEARVVFYQQLEALDPVIQTQSISNLTLGQLAKRIAKLEEICHTLLKEKENISSISLPQQKVESKKHKKS